ncbi:serine--tRNA synthetase-like protein Slimp [Musca vetustissima]|uniref:serine--tRNA synthetase-like protein Slimp n=1 Tax=Musca vetustissima TaxID=27455 RepID=UPI002AB6C30E|nr:serine--tRNA synthetase-like protein Slimp [Musca vetustissima]
MHISKNIPRHHAIYATQRRQVSALYITGDKARENYVTIQPYLDFKGTFENMEQLQHSIKKRNLAIDLNKVQQMFENYTNKAKEIDKVEQERELIAKQLKDMGKVKDNNNTELMNQLKDKGKELRNKLKSLKTDFYPIEDEFCQAFLHLPNLLDRQCPEGEHERILYRSKLNDDQSATTQSHLQQSDQINFIDNSRYYLMKEAAKFDLYCTDALVKYFLQKEKFIQTCNPDFVRCVLLEANATPLDLYHKVEEQHLQNKLNSAYLTGGGAFESFLGAVTKLCVYPSVIPLRYICSGRLYEKSCEAVEQSLYTATQTNAVQTFVACENAQQSEEHMDAILNRCVDFYKTFDNLHFRVVYAKAADLMPSESLRAQIEVYSPHQKRYICVGRLSNYSDYVSKRILFTMREQKDYRFLHLIGGPILYTTRLIAALIECQQPLDYKKLMQNLKLKSAGGSATDSSNKMFEEFQSLFK